MLNHSGFLSQTSTFKGSSAAHQQAAVPPLTAEWTHTPSRKIRLSCRSLVACNPKQQVNHKTDRLPVYKSIVCPPVATAFCNSPSSQERKENQTKTLGMQGIERETKKKNALCED